MFVRVVLWGLIVIGVILAALALSFRFAVGHRYPLSTLRAFVVPSGSMCPTICKGERIMVAMKGNDPYVPKHGDVILLLYGPNRSLFIKRVVGLPGDTAGPGPGNTILVNGNQWTPPPICAKSLEVKGSEDNSRPEVNFPETHVPPGQIFVIGDNLNNSFDSRISQFDPVTPDKVIGKPLLIYFSPSASRIGCNIR